MSSVTVRVPADAASVNTTCFDVRRRAMQDWNRPDLSAEREEADPDGYAEAREQADDELFVDVARIAERHGQLMRLEHPRLETLFPGMTARLAVARVGARPRTPRSRIGRALRRAARASPGDPSSPSEPPLGGQRRPSS